MKPKEVYPLERHPGETDRLNYQNQLMIDAVGYVLHPVIKQAIPKNPKVAEPGTGTGAFLVSISKDISPGAQLHGFDISDAAFTSRSQLPANITLSIADIKGPAPAEHRSKYDLVCLRFLNAAMEPGEDWERAASHVLSLLKPGGAVQWIEGNFRQIWPVYKSKAETETVALEKGVKQAWPGVADCGWMATHFCNVLERVGFESVREDVMSTDRDIALNTRRRTTEIVIGALNSILRGQEKSGMPGAWPPLEMDALVKEMTQEADAGAYARFDLHQFLAFKPN